MTQYKVASDNCSLGVMGATVDSNVTDGLNVGALIEGGHLVAISVRIPKPDDTLKDK